MCLWFSLYIYGVKGGEWRDSVLKTGEGWLPTCSWLTRLHLKSCRMSTLNSQNSVSNMLHFGRRGLLPFILWQSLSERFVKLVWTFCDSIMGQAAPCPRPYTGRQTPGPSLAMCRLRGQAMGFFTPSLKFAPTGIRTQDLGGAAGVTRPADLAPFGLCYLFFRLMFIICLLI